MTTSLSELHRQNTENIVRAVVHDLKKSLQKAVFELENEIYSSEDVVKNRNLWQRVNGVKIAIEKIDQYEGEVINRMYPK